MTNDTPDMGSVLTSIKKLVGIAEEDTSFDGDLIFHINMAFSVLTQIGFGPETGITIEDEGFTWDDVQADPIPKNLAKTYVFSKVKMVFDPPTNSTVAEALKRTVDELESRIQYICDVPKS